jgi:hypothetical protein
VSRVGRALVWGVTFFLLVDALSPVLGVIRTEFDRWSVAHRIADAASGSLFPDGAAR